MLNYCRLNWVKQVMVNNHIVTSQFRVIENLLQFVYQFSSILVFIDYITVSSKSFNNTHCMLDMDCIWRWQQCGWQERNERRMCLKEQACCWIMDNDEELFAMMHIPCQHVLTDSQRVSGKWWLLVLYRTQHLAIVYLWRCLYCLLRRRHLIGWRYGAFLTSGASFKPLTNLSTYFM